MRYLNSPLVERQEFQLLSSYGDIAKRCGVNAQLRNSTPVSVVFASGDVRLSVCLSACLSACVSLCPLGIIRPSVQPLSCLTAMPYYDG